MRLAIAPSVLLLPALWISELSISAQSQDVFVSFATQPNVVLYEPVVLRLTILNRLSDQIETDLGFDRKGSLGVQVTRPDGTLIEPPGPVNEGLSRISTVLIPAGALYSQQYILDERLSFDRVGTYQLRVRLDSSFLASDGRRLNPLTASVLEVNVTPRDAARLRQLCARLVQRALNEPAFEAQMDAARTLSHLADPVAVPCIENVFRTTNRFDALIAPALARIGTEDARRALEEMFKSTDDDRFRLAGDALGRFRQPDR